MEWRAISFIFGIEFFLKWRFIKLTELKSNCSNCLSKEFAISISVEERNFESCSAVVLGEIKFRLEIEGEGDGTETSLVGE
jgi:hypothetical protein